MLKSCEYLCRYIFVRFFGAYVGVKNRGIGVWLGFLSKWFRVNEEYDKEVKFFEISK